MTTAVMFGSFPGTFVLCSMLIWVSGRPPGSKNKPKPAAIAAAI
jgi:hypothetical protein